MHTVDHTKNIIEIEHVSFFHNNQPILNDISLSIHKGDYIGIIGGNGAGKTTLLKVILGLQKPDSGTVRLFGDDIKDFKDWPKMGYVPQKATSFDTNFPATVEEIVQMGRFGRLGLFHNIKKADRTAVKKALEQVDMYDERKRLIGDLSGGQQQRVFIARALAGNPEVIFLDEPTVGVEKEVEEDFYDLLRKLNTENNLTIVIVTHDIDSIAKDAMHIACIDKSMVLHETVDEYFRETHSITHPHA